jgi:hypothetical protein
MPGINTNTPRGHRGELPERPAPGRFTEFRGPLAEAALERPIFDRVFLGPDAVTVDDGICETDQAQPRLKELRA